MSDELVESISSVEFQPDGEQQVVYNRLFLGLGRI